MALFEVTEHIPDHVGGRAVIARGEHLVFTGAVTPHDVRTGSLVATIDGLPGELRSVQTGRYRTDLHQEPVIAQAWQVYATLAALLAKHGSSIDLLARQRLFLADLRDLPVIERVMDLFLPAGRPATTVVAVPTSHIDPALRVRLDAVAAMVGDGHPQPERIELLPSATAAPGYPDAVRVGQFVFVSGTVGINVETGSMAATRSEVSTQADSIVDYALTSTKEERLMAQAWHLFANIERVLQTQGSRLADILKVNGWAGFPMIEAEPVFTVREHLFPTRDAMPGSATVSIEALPREDALMSYDCVAVAPDPTGAGYRKEVRGDVYGLVPMLVPAAQAGPLIFTCGDVAIDAHRRRTIASFADLEAPATALPFGRPHPAPTIEAQAHFVYGIHQAALEKHGASMDAVIHQTVFLRDPTRYEALQNVAATYFGSRLPPTTIVPVRDTSPWRGNRLEIEMVACTKSELGRVG